MVSIVLAEYFTTKDNTLLFIGRSEFLEPLVKEIPLAIDEVRRFVTDNFGTAEENGMTKVRNLDLAGWQKRFRPLVEPLLPYAHEGDIIWFVLHDALHYLPFHALQIDGRYLIDRNPVCYTPSASVMKFCYAKRKRRRERALVIGDSCNDLFYAHDEALAVASLFKTEPFLRDQATKSLVLEQLAREREQLDVLHFACHGYFSSQEALKSGIRLASEPDVSARNHAEQWDLTAEEIFGLSINAELIILSACETGVNERKPGDELIGLTRALIYAGTPSVIVSLWSVDDLSTSLLMQHFYQQWLKPPEERNGRRTTKAEALQSAQKYVRNLTAQQVVEYCEQNLARLENAENVDKARQLAFTWGCVYAQTVAGDWQSARSRYQEFQNQLGTLAYISYRNLKPVMNKTLLLPEDQTHQAQAPDYNRRPFENVYFWAPFVLIGDGQ